MNETIRELLWDKFEAHYSHSESFKEYIWGKCFTWVDKVKAKYLNMEFETLSEVFDRIFEHDPELMNYSIYNAVVIYANRSK